MRLIPNPGANATGSLEFVATRYVGPGANGGLANNPSNPSAAVGWVKIASRNAVYGMPPIIAVWTTAIGSLASAPECGEA